MIQIIIGIQARSTSKRFPNKVMYEVGGKPIIEHVIDSCNEAALFINRQLQNVKAKTMLLVPFNDKLVETYKNKIDIFEGDENDVLSRYVDVMKDQRAEYIVRITGDCIFMPSYIISRAVKTAVRKRFDYVSNTIYRCHPEGFDLQLFSRELMDYLDKNAKTSYQREHVGVLIDEGKESNLPFKVSCIFEKLNLSQVKTSVDTEEEAIAAEAHFQNILNMKEACVKRFGLGSVSDGS